MKLCVETNYLTHTNRTGSQKIFSLEAGRENIRRYSAGNVIQGNACLTCVTPWV